MSDLLIRSIGSGIALQTALATELWRTFADASQSGTSVSDLRGLAKRFAQRPDVIETPRGDMTTTELVHCERRLIASAIDLKDAKPRVPRALTERAISCRNRTRSSSEVRAPPATRHSVCMVEASLPSCASL